MDPERTKKHQSLKVIISEFIMVITVIITVIILALLVSGYWINSDFEVERQGMLQISSVPTGADVAIDGESSWLQRTNTSKVLASGEHAIVLTKDGYDSWSKTITISEGLLYRIRYPRLFPSVRTKENIYDIIGTTKVFVSENHETMLLYSGDSDALDTKIFANTASAQGQDPATILPEWIIINLNSDMPESKPVTLHTLYDFFKEPDSPAKDTIADFNPNLQLSGTEELIFSKFYEDRYLTVVDNSNVTLYKKDAEEPILTIELSFIPADIIAGPDGEFIVFSAGSQIATLDMEAMSVKEWSVDGSTFGWFDDYMLYSVKDGELYVYDFDGFNRRALASNVSARFPVIVTRDKWLYYFSDDNLIRENLISR